MKINKTERIIDKTERKTDKRERRTNKLKRKQIRQRGNKSDKEEQTSLGEKMTRQ
jgi:hypothetical protein